MISRVLLVFVTLLACGTSRGLAGSANTHGEHSRGLWQINATSSNTQNRGATISPWTTTHGIRTPVRPTLMIRPSTGTFRVR